ncbi:rab-like protein 6 [Anopheles aquasalis]|uniref:rab-like protein 6 n=1 Tax=Anopheles aquasalis TaxID=42839 RepID=UPI00215B70E9|nr:rab-like protein 6 [Anopheles aquasalis]
MFSVFKKLAAKNEAPPSVSIPESVGQTMSDSLKKRFSRGVQYNMKVVIKGDRNVGKSCLLERLQGRAFIEQYTPTEQIQVASIQWSFKATDDVVKVEVWDVVDRGKSKQKSTNLKLTTAGGSVGGEGEPEIPVLDAEFLDVYKGTHCVVMVMDITKAWTFDYVCRELPKVPSDIPVLLLGNHCDMGHHRVITPDQVHGFVETAARERRSELIYGDSSMRNGFGLRLLHKFFGIPFLYLQKSALEATLRKNAQDLDICRLEIDEYQKSDDSDYGRFLEQLISKKKSREGAATGLPGSSFGPDHTIRPTKSIILGGGHPIIVPDRNSHLAVASTTTVNTTKLSNPQKQLQEKAPPRSATMATLASDIGFGKIDNVDEFCPDGGVLDKSFLDDTGADGVGSPSGSAIKQLPGAPGGGDSDDDDGDEHHNPLVSRFDEEDVAGEDSPVEEPAKPARQSPVSVRRHETGANDVRKFSLSSVELEVERIGVPARKSATKHESRSPEEEEETVTDGYDDSWTPIDTKERRSPEGGEDVASTTSVSRQKKSSEDKKVKDKDKKHKKKKSSKEKEERTHGEGKHHRSGHSKRKSTSSSSNHVVDEFLKEMQSTGPADTGSGDVDDAYEAI